MFQNRVVGFDEFLEDYKKCALPEYAHPYTPESFMETFMEHSYADCLAEIMVTLESDASKGGIMKEFMFEISVDMDDTQDVIAKYMGYD